MKADHGGDHLVRCCKIWRLEMILVQQGEKDCGAACLAMVLGISLEGAREALFAKGWIEDQGAKPSQILEALEAGNFSARYSYGYFLDEHLESLNSGGTAILTVKSKTKVGGWHYIVLQNGEFYDPQEGRSWAIYHRNTPL